MARTTKRSSVQISAPDQFRFRQHDSIGVADAEDDEKFLETCFVDTGDLGILADCDSHARIVLGRTGSGKTALLRKLLELEHHVIPVKPDRLALAYITNSTILNFVSQLNVKLDTFFRLLWRHVFTVEILKAHFKIDDEESKIGFIDKIKTRYRGKKHVKALEYLERWGKSYWQETEYRIKEVTTNFEKDLRASIGTSLIPASFGIESVKKLSEEQKQEVIQRAQHVVNEVQIKELGEVIELLADVLEDPQKRYYIVIDRLDEDWVEDKIRYLLIRALIETIRDFLKVRQAKIVIALRYDLVDRVIRQTRSAGYQEEKYSSLYLPLKWTKANLIQVLDTRIDYLVRQRYTKQRVTHKDLLPRTIGKQPTMDYLIDRTLMRPRDIIFFFNRCIAQAANSPKITSQMLKVAEGEYSRDRLRSVAEEWVTDYPNLLKFIEILKKRPTAFRVGDITEEQCETLCYSLIFNGLVRDGDELSEAAYKAVDDKGITLRDFRNVLIQIFYRVGIVGLKLETFQTVVWSFDDPRSIPPSETHYDTRVAIHPCFWRTLGTTDK